MQKLTLAVVTDIHHGTNYGTKLGEAALPLLDRFRDACAAAAPDLVLELGDRINNESPPADRRRTQEVAAAFAPFPQDKIIHLLGNHDCYSLARTEAETVFQQRFCSHSRDQHGFHLVFWNAEVSKHAGAGFVASAADLEWLQRDLAATALPTIVCSHIPLDGGSMAGNLYFEQGLSAGLGGYANSAEVRHVIEASGVVVLCIAGHTHWNALSIIDGTAYVTIPSLTDAFMSWPQPAGAWAFCELADDIRIRVCGEVPAEYRLPMRQRDRHWVNKYREYAPKPPARITPKAY